MKKSIKKVVEKTPNQIIDETFADLLKKQCDRLTVVRVARECGVTTRSIQFWMNGEGKPNLATKVGCITILNACN